MSERGEKTYRPWEPERYRQDAHSPAAKLPEGDLDVHFISSPPVKQRPACMAWADKRLVQSVEAEG